MRLIILVITFLTIAGCRCSPFANPFDPMNCDKVSDADGHRYDICELMYDVGPSDEFNQFDHVASLFFFVLSDCPISNAYAPEIERITREYAPRGVQTFVVFCDPAFSRAAAREHMKSYGLSATALLDEHLHVANWVRATIAPEAALASRGKVHYLGRIDDKFAALGVNREVVTEHNLRESLDDLLEGRPITSPRVAAVGCYISRD